MRARDAWLRRGALLAGACALMLAAGAAAQTTATARTPATVLPANPPTCTAKTLGVSRASNPGLAADCDTLLAIRSTLRVSGRIDYDTPSLWDHSYALNWSAITPLRHWRAVTLGGTPERVIGLDFGDTRESVRVYDARTRRWAGAEPFTREWTLRGAIPTQLGNLTALETLDLGGGELTGAVPTQLGNLTRLRTLDLSNNRLTGELPEELDALTALTRVRVAGNAFTRCAPNGLRAAASHDLFTLALPNCRPTVKYGAPQATGVVDARGEYAFFTATGTAITTYEGLRNDVARLTIHEQDTVGTSWAWFYDGVQAGDVFEWRTANDCWVRYVVNEVLADPSAMLKSLSVEWVTYAFTGCSGTVSASVTGRSIRSSMKWGALPDLGGASLTVPVVHGPWQIVPDGWTGATAASEYRWPPAHSSLDGITISDVAAARQLPFWRDPDLPAGWTFVRADNVRLSNPTYGYCALYATDRGFVGVEICGYYVTSKREAGKASLSNGLGAYETRWIAGRPATINYAPNRFSVMQVYDAATESAYSITGYDRALRGGNNLDAIAGIARSLFGEAAAQPRAHADAPPATGCADAWRAGNAGLVADCDALLAARDALAGEGALNWSASTALAEWDGVTVSSAPLRVAGLDLHARGLTGVVPAQLGSLTALTSLDLSNNRLTGALPAELDDLDTLGRVRLAGNAFTGCAPAELWRLTSHDLDALGLPNCKPPLTYGAPSRTGIVDAPGEHAFLTDQGPALTYEALRNDVLRVVIHKQDAGGLARDAIYDDVEAGDDFEWREADDCWVRYLVERVLPDPTDMPLKVLAVRRYGYAYTGCSGMVSLTGSRTLTWIPPNIREVEITVPVRHGPWLLVKGGYEGNLEKQQQRSAVDGNQAGGASTGPAGHECSPSNLREAARCMRERSDQVELSCQTASIDEARQCKGWREPVLPEGWFFGGVYQGVNTLGNPPNAYTYGYGTGQGDLEVVVFYREWQPIYWSAFSHATRSSSFREAIFTAVLIGGRPALLVYFREPGNRGSITVRIYDEETGIEYTLRGRSPELRGTDPTEMIRLARSLFATAP